MYNHHQRFHFIYLDSFKQLLIIIKNNELLLKLLYTNYDCAIIYNPISFTLNLLIMYIILLLFLIQNILYLYIKIILHYFTIFQVLRDTNFWF
jgi:hypothetical protein